ncbi:hypothetical protein [Vibrio cionasavignyae]|uniref:hypothetical protein n=1 Tax=Vibrio cionasavignyae TaxID=2910252 RepID=UPI003D1106AB
MKLRYSAIALAAAAALSGCNSESNDASDNNGQPWIPPSASNVVLKGDPLVGSTLTGQYQFTDANHTPRPEGDSLYAWMRQNAQTPYVNDSVIGNDLTLPLLPEHDQSHVYFCVTPVADGTSNTVGDQACSAPVLIDAPDHGEKPEASNVTIDNTSPTVGDPLEGSYDYYDADGDLEADSEFEWQQDGSPISGADTKQFSVTNVQEGKTLSFCVTPVSENPDNTPHYPTIGDKVCSAVTDAVLPLSGDAPVANNVDIVGNNTVGSSLVGEYDYTDADGDLEGSSQLVWKRNDTPISGATSANYTIESADKDQSLTFCVTPEALTGLPTTGAESCSAPMTDIGDPVGDVPTVTLKTITSDNDVNHTILGDVLTAGYDYTPSSSGSADNSSAVWKAAGTVINDVSCATGSDCTITVKQEYIGKDLSYCVTPKANDSVAGTEQCTTGVKTFGIDFSGKLEFGQDVTVTTHGYTVNGISWKIDTSNIEGPAGDLSRVEVATEATGATTDTYTIGGEIIAKITPEFESTQGNNNGVVDDNDWHKAMTENVFPVDEANSAQYIGKELEVCIDTTEKGEQCFIASEQSDITGGVYYDELDATKRAIEPARQVVLRHSGKAVAFHRPLSAAEAKLKDQVGYGASIPDYTRTQLVNGIQWAVYSAEIGAEKVALNVCLNLKDDSAWFLPSSRADSSYKANIYVDQGNAAPEFNYLMRLTKIASNTAEGLVGRIEKDTTDYHVSPIYGWPINGESGTPMAYWSASQTNANTDTLNAVQFYKDGSSGNNSMSNWRYVSCAQVAQ